MQVRMFGGWELPADICERANLVELGYEIGVPMGGDLPAPPTGVGAPAFVVSAAKDPGTVAHPGTDLQRIQIIKSWIDADGESRVAVFDIAGEIGNGGVDPATCRIRNMREALCLAALCSRFRVLD